MFVHQQTAASFLYTYFSGVAKDYRLKTTSVGCEHLLSLLSKWTQRSGVSAILSLYNSECNIRVCQQLNKSVCTTVNAMFRCVSNSQFVQQWKQRSGVSASLSLYNSERSVQMCQQLNKSQFVQQYLSSSFHGQRASILLPVVVTTGHLISFNDHCYVNSLMYWKYQIPTQISNYFCYCLCPFFFCLRICCSFLFVVLFFGTKNILTSKFYTDYFAMYPLYFCNTCISLDMDS